MSVVFSKHSGGAAFYLTGNLVQNILLIDCIAEETQGYPAYDFEGPKSVELRNCVAIGGVFEGFKVINGSRDFSFINCSSNGNSGNGFTINVPSVALRNCSASVNTANGFEFNSTTTNCQLMSCSAMNNGGVGIQDNSTNTGNRYYNNVALNNGTADFDPLATFVPPAAIVVASGGLTAITGYWANIRG